MSSNQQPLETIFIAKREYDREGYSIVGIFKSQEEADTAIETDKKNGYGEFHSVAELEIGRYFDIGHPGA